MKTSEILFRAREIQLERGRTSGAYENARGGVCMIGAVRLACGAKSGNDKVFGTAEALDTIRKLVGAYTQDFSDDVCKTKYDMAAAFEIAACCASAEGK